MAPTTRFIRSTVSAVIVATFFLQNFLQKSRRGLRWTSTEFCQTLPTRP